MLKAYGVLQIKALDADARTIEGVASTITPDRMQDIVVPEGAQFALPLPLLYQHDTRQPIGSVTDAAVKDGEITIKAQIAKTDTPGTLKDRLDEAWESVKLKLIRGLSIGFRAIESADIDGSWGQKFLKWEWLELSVVTIPANAEANIIAVKRYDGGAPLPACLPTKRVHGGYVLSELTHIPVTRRNADGSIQLH